MRRRVVQNCLQKKRTRSDIEAPTRQISVSDGWREEKNAPFPPPPVPGQLPRPLFHSHLYPAKFPGLGEALIFFCFFSSIKGRKEDHSKAEKNAYSRYRLFVSYQKTPKGRMQYAPTARYLTGFAFVLPKIWVKPAGFHSDLWQSLKPAGFCAMSFGRVQNPPGFTLCRVAESKTRRVLRYVVWRNAKPAGFWGLAMIFFSSLDGRKEAKEDQGLTEAGEFGRIQVGVRK